MCGAETELVDAIIEGTLLHVCRRCAGFGETVAVKGPAPAPLKQKKAVVEEALHYVVPDYAVRVKQAREKRGWTQEDLARSLRERESVIHKIESGHMKPPLALAQKLEKALGITLVELYEEPAQRTVNFKDSALTIGDLVKLKSEDKS